MIKGTINKYHALAIPIKASIWFAACGVLKDSVDVLATPIFTRLLTTDEYGIFNVYNSWFQIAKIIITLNLFSEVFNVGLIKFEHDRDRFVSATLGFITGSVCCYSLAALCFCNYVVGFVGLPGYLIFLLFVHILVYAPYYCWITRERFDYHYRNVAWVSLLYVILQPLTGILAIACTNLPLNPGHTRIISAVAVQIIIGMIIYACMMLRGKCFFNNGYWKYSFKTGITLVPFNLSRVVLHQSDRLMINYFAGLGATGIYSVAYSAAFALSAVTGALQSSFVPWFYQKLKRNELDGANNVIDKLLILVSLCVVSLDIIAPEAMQILGDKRYQDGVYCIPSLAYSVYLIFLSSIFAHIELYFGKNIYVSIVGAIGMVANVAMNYLLIPKLGFIVAGYTTLLAYILICIGHVLLLNRCFRHTEHSLGQVMNAKKILVISSTLLGFTLFCPLLYSEDTIRWFIVAVIIMVSITARRFFFSFFDQLDVNRDQ